VACYGGGSSTYVSERCRGSQASQASQGSTSSGSHVCGAMAGVPRYNARISRIASRGSTVLYCIVLFCTGLDWTVQYIVRSTAGHALFSSLYSNIDKADRIGSALYGGYRTPQKYQVSRKKKIVFRIRGNYTRIRGIWHGACTVLHCTALHSTVLWTLNCTIGRSSGRGDVLNVYGENLRCAVRPLPSSPWEIRKAVSVCLLGGRNFAQPGLVLARCGSPCLGENNDVEEHQPDLPDRSKIRQYRERPPVRASQLQVLEVRKFRSSQFR
jgi:hypothetical protein